ncbi:MAG: hypothetical protein ACTSYA_04450 [Candidatus Kariarchaeaceae archaeon]
MSIIALNRYFYSRIRLIFVIIALMLVWITVNLIPLVINLFPMSSLEEEVPLLKSANISYLNLLLSISVILGVLAPSICIIFFSRFSGNYSITRVTYAISSVTSMVVLSISSLVFDISVVSEVIQIEDIVVVSWSPISYLIILPAFIFLVRWGLSDLKESKYYAINKKQERQINFMRLGLIMTCLIGPIISVFSEVINIFLPSTLLSFWVAEVIGFIIMSSGVIMIGVAYSMTKQIAFLLPQKVEKLLVIHNSGVPIFDYDFRPNVTHVETLLVGGVISTINKLFSEVIGSHQLIESIRFHGDYEIILVFKEPFAFVLIANRRSEFLINRLYGFSEIFFKQFKKEISKDAIYDISVFDNAVTNLRTTFGLPHQ